MRGHPFIRALAVVVIAGATMGVTCDRTEPKSTDPVSPPPKPDPVASATLTFSGPVLAGSMMSPTVQCGTTSKPATVVTGTVGGRTATLRVGLGGSGGTVTAPARPREPLHFSLDAVYRGGDIVLDNELGTKGGLDDGGHVEGEIRCPTGG